MDVWPILSLRSNICFKGNVIGLFLINKEGVFKLQWPYNGNLKTFIQTLLINKCKFPAKL